MSDPIETHPDYSTLQDWWATRLTAGRSILAQAGIDAVWWSYGLAGGGVVQDLTDLDQAVRVILTTPQGSDPHRPTFASNINSFLDLPIPRATPFVVRESTAAVETWEPRVALQAVDVQPYTGGIERLTVTAEWTVVEAAIAGQTEVRVG